MNNENIKSILSDYPQYRGELFIRGFLITDASIENFNDFPFYGNWNSFTFGKWNFLTHKDRRFHHYIDESGNLFFLLGHCYNPFTMESDEIQQLADISKHYGKTEYFDSIDELTGIFLYGVVRNDGTLEYVVDPAGIEQACCGKIGDHLFTSSHPQLIGDICDLEMDPFVKELVTYKWYGRVMGPYLPADLTPFSQIKRIVPNHFYTYDGVVHHKRFYPLTTISETKTDEEYDKVIKEAADILRNNMKLVSKKWNKPWISLTGGIDSNTTFAAANGIYDRFNTFSYISAEKEIRDAEAAKKISEQFHIPHHVYNIPNTNDEIKDYDVIRSVLMHNNGYIAETGDNEIRKRIVLRNNTECDVEVKSWVSETIRAYWYKHYGRKTMPHLSAKLYRNLYKIFITNRRLAHKIDKIYEKYIDEYEYKKVPESYPTADINFNEVTWGSWGSLNIAEMKYCFDITIIYDNRKFLDLLFRVPLEKRISDQHHLDMKKYLNKELYDMNIRIVNMKETPLRAFLLNVLFTINTILPF